MSKQREVGRNSGKEKSFSAAFSVLQVRIGAKRNINYSTRHLTLHDRCEIREQRGVEMSGWLGTCSD